MPCGNAHLPPKMIPEDIAAAQNLAREWKSE
jgi:hypothetical protein